LPVRGINLSTIVRVVTAVAAFELLDEMSLGLEKPLYDRSE
jgi:hypothetical protein